MTTSAPPRRGRFSDLRIRTKLLLLVGAPFAAFAVMLVGLILAYRVSAAADDEAIHWARHAVAISELDSLATAYVDLVTNETATRSAHGGVGGVERALARARSEAEELVGYFSAEEQVEDRQLLVLLGELVARGKELDANPERVAALRAFFVGTVAPQLDRRVAEEKRGTERAAAAAEAIRARANIGAIGGSLVILTLALGLLLGVARRFASRISQLEQRARRVAIGDLTEADHVDATDELGQLARSLDEMVETLRLHRRDQFAFVAAVAHDFRGSLGVIQLTTDRLLQTPAEDQEKLRHALTVIERAVMRLGRLANDLIDASRIEAGEFQLQRELVDVRTIASDIADQYAAASPKHTFEVIVPDAPVPVLADPARLSQVLENLITNAIKYSSEGGRIEIEASQHDDVAVLSVTDHGAGIEEGSLQRIFEPFRRVSNVAQGLGLGLAIARRLVDAHQGVIDAKSILGQGSTFRVRLPLARVPASEGLRANVGLPHPALGV